MEVIWDMKMLSSILNNQLKHWPTYSSYGSIKLDLRNYSLNGIRIGDKWDKLIEIGKPDNNNALRIDAFEYKELGCIITITDGIISSFYINLSSSRYDNAHSKQIDLICEDGATVHLDSNSKIAELQPHIEDETRKEVDEDGITFVYESNTTILEIDCFLDDIIIGITVESNPNPLPEIKHTAFNKRIRFLTIFTYFVSLCSVILFFVLLFNKSFTIPLLPFIFPFVCIFLLQLCKAFTICPQCHRFIFGRHELKHKENIKFRFKIR